MMMTRTLDYRAEMMAAKHRTGITAAKHCQDYLSIQLARSDSSWHKPPVEVPRVMYMQAWHHCKVMPSDELIEQGCKKSAEKLQADP